MIDLPETINREAWERFPEAPMPVHYLLSASYRTNVSDAPPGHPDYFLHPIFTLSGGEPNEPYANNMLLGKPIRMEWHTILDDLYAPLPYKHGRVQEWVAQVYRRNYGLYSDPEQEVSMDGKPYIVVPVPSWKLRPIDKTMSKEERDTIHRWNDEYIQRCVEWAKPKRHLAHKTITKWYPDAPLRTDLIGRMPARTSGWERGNWREGAEHVLVQPNANNRS